MKNIRTIFFSDIKALLTHFFPLVITLGLCALPALYAWFNIYSNWDPYGNTGNIKIAVASDDKGYTKENGEQVNIGDEVIDSLKKNTSIHWVFTNSADAVEGVESGDYYASVVLSEDFSACMYHGFLDGLKRPTITYYENQKKNAVANKITDTAVGTLENNINEMYISIIVSTAFSEADKDGDSNELNSVEKCQKKIEQIDDNLAGYESTIGALISADEKLQASLDDAGEDLVIAREKAKKAGSSASKLDDTSFGILWVDQKNKFTVDLKTAISQFKKAEESQDLEKQIAEFKKGMKALESAIDHLDKIEKAINELKKVDPDAAIRLQTVLDVVKSQKNNLELIQKDIKKRAVLLQEKGEDAFTEAIKEWELVLDNANEIFENVLVPLVDDLADKTETAVKDISKSMESLVEDIDILEDVLGSTNESVDAANSSLEGLQKLITQTRRKLASLNTTLSNMTESEFVHKVNKFLSGDPEGYGKFFAAPVKIKSEAIYPVENYGSGVTPFYTTLALWVGGIFLVSLIKVKPSKKKLKNAKPHELFLGRFILFFILGQIQTLIIVLGDILLLGVQCLDPFKFWLASSIASFTFTLLIYALTVSFGDIGKALVVVIVVLQIAGSSGTYPIEILPQFYQKVYIFFPFPYAINAMREAICGTYEHDYAIYLMELLLFALVALLLGLVIRLPFMGVNHFMEKRMEDTEMM